MRRKVTEIKKQKSEIPKSGKSEKVLFKLFGDVSRSVREMKNSQMCRHSEYSVSGVKNFVVVFKSWMLRYSQHDKQLLSF